MPLVVPNAGERRLLEYIVGKSSLPNGQLVLHLYTNLVDLSTEQFSTGSFTEASGYGYNSVTLIGSDWTISTNVSGISSAIYNTGITFSFSNSSASSGPTIDIQGYYVTNNANDILWAEEFPGAPFSLPGTGGEIAVRPQVQLN
jgi:hypothetical protein